MVMRQLVCSLYAKVVLSFSQIAKALVSLVCENRFHAVEARSDRSEHLQGPLRFMVSSRSWSPAACTRSPQSSPCVSTAMCLLRPLIFLLRIEPPKAQLIGVETTNSAHARAGNRLTVYDQRAWLPVAALPPAGRPTRDAQKTPDTPFLAPPPEIVVHRLPGGKFSGQHAPLRSRFDHVQNCIQHVIPEAVAASALGCKIAANLLPLGVRHVGVIALLSHGSGESFFGKVADSFRKRGGLPSVFGEGC